jgi:hypothetical protein
MMWYARSWAFLPLGNGPGYNIAKCTNDCNINFYENRTGNIRK